MKLRNYLIINTKKLFKILDKRMLKVVSLQHKQQQLKHITT